MFISLDINFLAPNGVTRTKLQTKKMGEKRPSNDIEPTYITTARFLANSSVVTSTISQRLDVGVLRSRAIATSSWISSNVFDDSVDYLNEHLFRVLILHILNVHPYLLLFLLVPYQ